VRNKTCHNYLTIHRSLVVIVHTSLQRRQRCNDKGIKSQQQPHGVKRIIVAAAAREKDFFVELSSNKCDLGIVIAKAKRNGILGSHTKAFAN